ncbi:DUF6082 family protein [Streptomyces phaeochromogenes]|uniref:DUF6082 family protein n=1 Tax=Streptomyces phaeochromogenes TaxID=1923 RepID=UPI0033D90741
MTQYRLWKQRALWLAAGSGLIGLIAWFPFILRATAPPGVDWNGLSQIGQTYGAVSVLFSAAAFLGVIISILHQAKQTQTMHEEIRSSIHKELILRALDDESLMYCWDPPIAPSTVTEARQTMFCNLIYRLWLTEYVVGRANLEATQITLEIHFNGEVARRHWGMNGHLWIKWAMANARRREQEFFSLTQQVYEKAVATGPPVESSSYFLPPHT